MAALTLLEAKKLYGNDPMKEAVIETFASTSDVLRVLPFENIEGTGIDAKREDTLPSIGFRGVNATWTAGTGNLEDIKESLKIAGGTITVDKFIVDQMGERQRAVQTQMKLKAAALKLTQSFIKGDESGDPTVFDGLQNRLGATAGDQVIHAGATSGGDALSLLKLDELIDSVENPQYLLMNKTLRRRLTVAARTTVGGQIDYVVDDFGKQVARYNGLPILIADKDNTNTAIMPFTEANPGGGTAASTSIYCLSFGEGMLTGIQAKPIETDDQGLSGTVYTTLVEWYVNWVLWHPRAVSRLLGIKDAVVTV